MAPKFTIKKPDASTYSGWAFVLVVGALLALVALIDRGGLDELRDGATGCQLEVSADELDVRSGPSRDAPLVEVLTKGKRVDGTRVVTDGFRELGSGRWAANQSLTPLVGTNCA